MSAPAAVSRRTKAVTLVPLLFLSGAWTLSLVNGPAGAAGSQPKPLPDGGSVPTTAIQQPATPSTPGYVGTVPEGSTSDMVNNASADGIPTVALTAYNRTATILESAAPGCRLSWTLVAAIGRVESDHGQFNGSTLDASGEATPAIIGPRLDGSNGTQAVPDTDGGVLDGDTQFDHAVGPMQFLPSTWAVVKVDADADGNRDPQNINDASLATGVYLCSGGGNLSTHDGAAAAVFRYNHSQQYVNTVLALADAYSKGNYTALPYGSYGGSVLSPSTALPEAAPTMAPPSDASTTTAGGTQPSTPQSTSKPAPGAPAPAPAPVNNPLAPVVAALPSQLAVPLQQVTAPVAQLLSSTQALSLCTTQFAAIPDPLNLLSALRQPCATKVTGMTPTAGLAAIPTTLQGVLAWLQH